MRSLVAIDAAAVRSNVARLRDGAGGDVWAVVKADGYGHGAADVGRAALAAGAIGLAVATLDEARALRAVAADARILVLSPLDPGEESGASGFEVCISDTGAWERIRDVPRVGVHVKVDTGMGRWGLDPVAALEIGRAATSLLGLMSHLATSEDRDPAYAREQVRRFRQVAATFPPCARHLANSGGALYLPETRFDMARCGIALYGISPRDEDPAADGLRPALTWQSEVRAIRDLPPGASSGYGRRIIADRPLRLAMVPVGYADGYPRRAAGTMHALVRGREARVGAVAMDQLALVLPEGLDARPGDLVTLIGRDGTARAGIDQLAVAAGTNGYEIACAIRPRGRREVLGA
jgi:alanine racemase